MHEVQRQLGRGPLPEPLQAPDYGVSLKGRISRNQMLIRNFVALTPKVRSAPISLPSSLSLSISFCHPHHTLDTDIHTDRTFLTVS